MQMMCRQSASKKSMISRQWVMALLVCLLIFVSMFACRYALAADGAEFQDGADKLEKWIKGNLGKVAALASLIVGVFLAAWKKDFTALVYSIVIALLIGIIVGIINSSFTATI